MKKAQKRAFFYQSPTIVFFAGAFSGSFYLFYWFYKQWKTVGITEGKRPHAFIAAIFNEFTAFILFKKIWQAAPSSTVIHKHFYLIPAIASIVVSIADIIATFIYLDNMTISLAVTFLTAITNSLIFAGVQTVINSTAPQKTVALHRLSLNPAEIVFLVVGFTIMFINVSALLFLPSANTVIERTDDFDRLTTSLDKRFTELDTAYTNCTNDLNTRFKTLDSHDEVAVTMYNNDRKSCMNVSKERDSVGDQILALPSKLIKSMFQK